MVGPSSACSPTMRRRVRPPRPPAGTSGRSRSVSSPRAGCAGGAGSSRLRTSSASERGRSRCSQTGGLVCASALGLAEGVPPEEAWPEPIVLRVGDEPGAMRSSSVLRSLGTSASRRRRSVGSSPFAAGSWTSSPPRAGSRSGSSSSATRSSRCGPSPRSRSGRSTRSRKRPCYPAAERRLDLVEPTPGTRAEAAPVPADLVAPLPAPDLVWQADEVEQAVREELGVELELGDAIRSRSFPPASAMRSRRSGPPSPRAAWPRPSATCSPTCAAGIASSSRSPTEARRSVRRGCSGGWRPSCSSPETTSRRARPRLRRLARAARLRPPRPRPHRPP